MIAAALTHAVPLWAAAVTLLGWRRLRAWARAECRRGRL